MGRKLTQKEVLGRFKKVHGDKYDYSLVEYENNRTDVIIICHKHGEFQQKPEKHFLGRGCSECGKIRSKENSKLTQKEVLDRFKKVHGDKYDYSLVKYEGANNKVKIKCFLHGSFQQIPYEHWLGQGCPQCGILKRSNSRRKTTEQFIEDAKLVHENFYDYSESIYNGNKNKIKIICPLHGIFEQTPDSHLIGSGCDGCSKISYRLKRGKKENEFISESKKIHGEIYNYQNVVYQNINTKVKIGCNIHGEFEQLPVNHLKGHGCKKCGNDLVTDQTRKTQEEFIKQASSIHDNYYQYDNVEYKSDKIKIKIACPIHGDFEQIPSNHLDGKGCPRCFNKSEGRLAIILNEIGVVHRNYRINNRYFDFYLPEYDLIIERDGEQHYYKFIKNWASIEENHQNDIEKTNLAKSKGHKICRIPYWLSEEDERKEIQNILNGQPTYPDVPDLEQAKTKPLPK